MWILLLTHLTIRAIRADTDTDGDVRVEVAALSAEVADLRVRSVPTNEEVRW